MGRVAPDWSWRYPAGKDPRRRMPWGSQIFVDPDGKPIKRADGQALRQYTSTGTATRCSPATASPCTPSSMNTAER